MLEREAPYGVGAVVALKIPNYESEWTRAVRVSTNAATRWEKKADEPDDPEWMLLMPVDTMDWQGGTDPDNCTRWDLDYVHHHNPLVRWRDLMAGAVWMEVLHPGIPDDTLREMRIRREDEQ